MDKITSWIKRYLPSEIAGTITAVVAGYLVYYLTGNKVLMAFAGAWGENIGFYGIIITKDISTSIKKHKNKALKYGLKSALKDMRNIIIEFGPAEILDSFVVRPFMMYTFPALLHNIPVGLLLGKIAADAIFYIPTIIMYEYGKLYLK